MTHQAANVELIAAEYHFCIKLSELGHSRGRFVTAHVDVIGRAAWATTYSHSKKESYIGHPSLPMSELYRDRGTRARVYRALVWQTDLLRSA